MFKTFSKEFCRKTVFVPILDYKDLTEYAHTTKESKKAPELLIQYSHFIYLYT